MTPSQRLRRTAAELLTLADELESKPGAAPMVAHVEAQERTVELGAAMTITGKSSTWLYKHAPKFKFGYQLATGSWLFSEPRLRAFMAGRTMAREENEMFEKNEAAPLALPPIEAHDSDMEKPHV